MNILQKIVENKKQELENRKSNSKKFREIFAEKNANLIAEIKLASPKFDYSDTIDIEKVFKFYGENKQIKAISNLIDEKYFSGDINRGKIFKQEYNKPIFFKEFVVNKTQIDGASYFGYDALLLLARVLNNDDLIEFIKYSNSKNIYPIVEVDCEEDLERVLKIGQTHRSAPTEKIVGVNLCVHPDVDFGIAINCRNLGTMEIDREKHFSIIEKFNKKLEKTIIFAFSGIDDLQVIEEYKGIYNGVLVGSYFMEKFRE